MRNHEQLLNYSVVVIVSFATAFSQTPQQSAPPLSNIDKRFYSTLAEAALHTDLEKTKRSGGGGGNVFAEVRPEGGILVGFDTWQGNWSGHLIIRGLRPIFQTATGRTRGESHGSTGGPPAMTVEAKEGYAVAAIEPRGGQRLDGFQVLFWKIRPTMGHLEADGAYKSDWIGGGGGGKTLHPLSSNGRPVLGICGASGTDVDRLGLIYAESTVFGQVADQPPSGKPDAIVGKWRSQSASMKKPIVVNICADCSLRGDVTGAALWGTWKLLPQDSLDRKYALRWGNGFVDTLVLSKDAKKLSGKNSANENVWSDRIETEAGIAVPSGAPSGILPSAESSPTAQLGSAGTASSSDQPFMSAALGYLQEAAKPNPSEAAKKIDRPGLLKLAKESLAKAPPIYQGRKAAAEKFIDAASGQLNTNKESEAVPTIRKAIAQVIEGINLVAQSRASRSVSKPDKGGSADPNYFGVSQDKP